jgi:hypothetical protein
MEMCSTASIRECGKLRIDPSLVFAYSANTFELKSAAPTASVAAIESGIRAELTLAAPKLVSFELLEVKGSRRRGNARRQTLDAVGQVPVAARGEHARCIAYAAPASESFPFPLSGDWLVKDGDAGLNLALVEAVIPDFGYL